MQHTNKTQIPTYHIEIPEGGQKGANWKGEKGEVQRLRPWNIAAQSLLQSWKTERVKRQWVHLLWP